MMVASTLLGTVAALVVALVLKHVDLRRNPSLEFGIMLLASYFPYCCAEAADLSGITSILFAGIVMSHYAHQNLSLVTQINVQNAFRAFSFLAETSVFAYLGMAIFSFQHRLGILLNQAWPDSRKAFQTKAFVPKSSTSISRLSL